MPYVTATCEKEGRDDVLQDVAAAFSTTQKEWDHDNERKIRTLHDFWMLAWASHIDEKHELAAMFDKVENKDEFLANLRGLIAKFSNKDAFSNSLKFRKALKSAIDALACSEDYADVRNLPGLLGHKVICVFAIQMYLFQGMRALSTEFAKATAKKNNTAVAEEGTDEDEALDQPQAQEWREEWGPAGDLSDDAPCAGIVTGHQDGPGGKHQTQTFLPAPTTPLPEDMYAAICSAIGTDALLGLKEFEKWQEFLLWQVPTPEVLNQHELDTDDNNIRIKAPKQGFLPLIGFIMLGFYKTYLVR